MNNNEFSNEENDSTMQHALAMFKDPVGHAHCLKSELFARDLLKLCNITLLSMQNEPRCGCTLSPCHVVGNMHGNLDDYIFLTTHGDCARH